MPLTIKRPRRPQTSPSAARLLNDMQQCLIVSAGVVALLVEFIFSINLTKTFLCSRHHTLIQITRS